MKMHVLTAAVLAALASQAVLAASEGGDTWSAVEPVQQPTYSVLKPSAPAPDAAFGGSEGGDTWSSLQALREMRQALEGLARLWERARRAQAVGNREYNPGWHTALDLHNLLTVSEAITLSALRSIVHALRGWPTPLGGSVNSAEVKFDEAGGASDEKTINTLRLIGRHVVEFAKR